MLKAVNLEGLMKKKLLIVAPYFVPEGGGLENYAYQVGKKLQEKYEVFVISATEKEAGIEDFEGMQVHRLDPSFFVSNTPIFLGLRRYAMHLLRDEEIDVVHAHMPVPFFADVAIRAAQSVGIPSVLTFHATALKKGSWTDVIELFYRPILRATCRKAGAVVAVTKKGREGILGSIKDVHIISPGVESVVDSIEREREQAFVFAGQLSESHSLKGLDVLLEALALIKDRDFKLYVAGDGDAKERYIKMTDKLGISGKVEFLGWVDREEMLKFAKKSLAVVIPSKNDAEGFPTVMPEAHSVGATLIASRVGGIPEMIIDEENGFLVEPNNPKTLSEKLEWALENEKKMVQMGERGLEIVRQKYTWERIAERYEELFSELAK